MSKKKEKMNKISDSLYTKVTTLNEQCMLLNEEKTIKEDSRIAAQVRFIVFMISEIKNQIQNQNPELTNESSRNSKRKRNEENDEISKRSR